MPANFGIVDLFAGPGGLGEGFASVVSKGQSPFRVAISVENETSAHRTLTLRAFLREYRRRHGSLPKRFIDFHAGLVREPEWATVDASAWSLAEMEARRLELGTHEAGYAIDASIKRLRRDFDETVLIGGPPCQAYSLVGRARAKGKRHYVPEQDKRHYLFREYIRVLNRLRPAAFIMENVKGMLSSAVDGRLVFEMLMEDLSSLGNKRGHLYELRAIRVEDGRAQLIEAINPKDFVVRAENFGVPQRRHRVIIIGIRSDLATASSRATIAIPNSDRSVADAIGNLPPLRSGLSRTTDSPEHWRDTITEAAQLLARIHRGKSLTPLNKQVSRLMREIRVDPPPRTSSELPHDYGTANDELRRWLERSEIRAISQHESRGHMPSDLTRYLFASIFAKTYGYSPKASDFPSKLSPKHRNWHSGVFNDRFRVQLADEAATTVTSHISKDGHYFIHPDPAQCRSLTVREAARLQTFPDDYLFLGNRTQQYVQVGNAVPPYLARQIAQLILKCIGGGAPSRLQ